MKIIAIGCFVVIGVGFVWSFQIGKQYNKTDWGHKGLNILDGINRWLCLKYHRLPGRFLELPESGPAILVSNHVSGLDPLLLIAATTRPLRFMIAQEEYDRWWLRWLLKRVGCIPVKRDKNPKKALNNSITALEKGEILVVFPQGEIMAENSDKPLKKGAFVLAEMAGVPVFSVRIEGVKAKGFTILAVFVCSKARITQSQNIHLISDDNIEQVATDIRQFFLGAEK